MKSKIKKAVLIPNVEFQDRDLDIETEESFTMFHASTDCELTVDVPSSFDFSKIRRLKINGVVFWKV